MRPGECIHLSIVHPGGHHVCAKGHYPRALAGQDPLGWVLRIPCRKPGSLGRSFKPEPACECPDFTEPTEEQLAEHEREVQSAIDKMLADVAAGKCHVCGADAEPTTQVGRCLYAACGHRIGQVSE